MKLLLGKLIAIGVLLFGLYEVACRTSKAFDSVLDMPKRVGTLSEVLLLDRLLTAPPDPLRRSRAGGDAGVLS